MLGFDARLQFLHPSDAIEALLIASRTDVPGTYNVAAPDIVTLSQALRKMGRPRVGVLQPVAPLVATLMRQARVIDFSADQIDALTYGRAMDTSRFVARDRVHPRLSRAWPPWRSSPRRREPGLISPERIEGALSALSGAIGKGLGAERWLTRRSSSWAAADRPGGAVAPVPRPQRATWPRGARGCPPGN